MYTVKTPADSIFTLLFLSNLHGKRPADYAVSVEMREIFQNASDGLVTSLSPSASLSVVCTHTAAFLLCCVCSFSVFDGIPQVSGCVRRGEMVLLATRLSQPEQQQLVRLGELLGGRVVDTFSASGRFGCFCDIKNVSQLRLIPQFMAA